MKKKPIAASTECARIVKGRFSRLWRSLGGQKVKGLGQFESMEARRLLSTALPAFEPLQPYGSLVYGSNVSDTFTAAGQTKGFTFTASAGQTVTATAEPGMGNLDVGLVLRNPGLASVASSSSGGGGNAELIQTYAVTAAGVYTVEVSNVSNTGNFRLGVVLNAAQENESVGGASNNTTATAQDIDGSFITPASGVSRAAVVGQFPTFLIKGETFEAGKLGTDWTASQSSSDLFLVPDDDLPGFPARIQITDAGPGGSSKALFMDRSNRSLDLNGVPIEYSLNEANWTVNLAGQSSVFLNFLHAEFGDTPHAFGGNFSGHANADGIAISADGTNWKPIWNAPDQTDGAWQSYTLDLTAAAAAKGISLNSNFKIRFQQYDTGFAPNGGRAWDNLSLTTAGVASASSDVYRVTLNAGENSSFAIGSAGGANVGLEVLDGSGNLLAIGQGATDDAANAVNGFVASTTGSYYVRVTGDAISTSGASYRLIVTRGADFGLESGLPWAPDAQELRGATRVLGSVGISPMGRLFATELYSERIREIDPITGAVLREFAPPQTLANAGSMATTSHSLLYASLDKATLHEVLHELDPNTGESLRSFPVNGAIAFLDNEIYAFTLVGNKIDVLDYATGALKRSFTMSFGNGAGGPIFTSQTDLYRLLDDTLYRIDRVTGQATTLGTIDAPRDKDFAASVIGNELFVVDWDQGTLNYDLIVYDLQTLARKRTIQHNDTAFNVLSDLAGDGGNRDADYYLVRAGAGDNLVISTASPLGGGATMDPAVEVYSAAGTLLASNDNGAADGRNASLVYTPASAGVYTVRVRSVNGVRGEYLLSAAAQPGTNALPAYAVTHSSLTNGATLSEAPTNVTFDLSNDVRVSSLNASDVKLNGVSCVSFTVIDSDTVSFELPSVGIGEFDVTLAPNAFLDLRGRGIAGLDTHVTVQAQQRLPVGGLVYEHVTRGQLPAAGSTETIPLQLDGGQTITVIVDPSSTLRPTIELRNPANALIGTITAAADGADAVLQTIAAPTSGIYVVTIRGANSTTGTFDARVVLNSGEENESHGGASNNSPGTAQNINGSLISLGGSASRGAVSGVLDSGASTPFLTENFDGGSLGAAWTTYKVNGEAGAIGTKGTAQGAGALIFYDGNGNIGYTDVEATWTVNLSGRTQALLSFWHGENGDTETAFTGDFTGHVFADGIAISNDGVNWHPIFNAPDQTSGQWQQYTIDLAAEAAAAGMTLGANFRIRFQADRVWTKWRGYDEISLSTPNARDFYSFSLNAGESATLGLHQLDQKPAHVDLTDAAGNVLASATAGERGFDEAVRDFIAPTTGTYYARITGADAARYALILGRNITLAAEPNNTPATAQDITRSGGVIGTAGYDLGRLFAYKVSTNQIVELDPVTGSILHSFTSPITTHDGYPQDIATTPTSIMTVGIFPGDNIFELNPDTGATLRVIANPGYMLDQIAYFRGEIFCLVSETVARRIVVLDYATGAIKRIMDVQPVERLIGSPYGLLDLSGSQINSIDPHTGAKRTLGNIGILGEGALVGDELISRFGAYNLDTLQLNRPLNISSDIIRLAGDGSYNDDHYTFGASAGDVLSLATTTPGDGPMEYFNDVDPVIELFDPDGLLVAIADNNASDGRNALLTWTAAKSGTYRIKVFAAGGSGEYALRLSGNTPPQAQFAATPQLLADSNASFSQSAAAITLNSAGNELVTFTQTLPAELQLNENAPLEVGDTSDRHEQALTVTSTGTNTRTLTVRGKSDPVVTVDEYTLNMNGRAGAKISVALDGVGAADFGDARVDLIGLDGITVLASSIEGGSVDQAIQNFTISTGGVYTLRLTTRGADGEYILSVDDQLTVASSLSADAGGPYSVGEGKNVSLSGAGSSGNITLYEWDLNYDGVTFTADATGVNASLTAPDGPATRTVALRVSGPDGSKLDTAQVNVTNAAPVANAGADKAAKVGEGALLAGTFTDFAADTQTFSWTVRDAANAIVATSTQQSFTFTPSAAGSFTATFAVTDDDGASTSDSAIVSVTPVATGPAVTQVALYNAVNDQAIINMTDGMVIDLATLASQSLAIRAFTNPTTVGSVLLGFDATPGQFNANYRMENIAPYALFGDDNGNLSGAALAVGQHKLVVTAFTGGNGSGAAGTPVTINFSVVNNPTTPLSVVTVSTPDSAASETGTEAGAITFTRSGDLSAPLALAITVGGTATPGVDLDAFPAFIIPAGAASLTVSVKPKDDLLVEGAETLSLRLDPSAAYTVGAVDIGTVSISDNDTAPSGPQVTSVVLYNATNDQSIIAMTDGMTIDLVQLPSRSLAVQAFTSPTTVGSVRLGFDPAPGQFNANYRMENIAPYALFGDDNGNLTGMDLAPGLHKLVITPFSGQNGSGTAGTPVTINFTVVDSPVTTQPTVNLTVSDNSASEPGSDTATFTFTRTGSTASALTLNVEVSGSAQAGIDFDLLPAFVIPQGATSLVVTVRVKDDQLIEGSETLGILLKPDAAYTVGASSSASITLLDNDSPQAGLRVDSLSLINAATDQPVPAFQLVDGAVINLAAVGNQLNIRAFPSPATVGSVRFNYDGNANYRIETLAPYAIGGDGNNGLDYLPWTPTIGNHTLIVTPYTGAGATGTAGESLTIHFSVVNQPTAPTAVRINVGGPAFTDSTGKSWEADNGFTGGTVSTAAFPVGGTVDDALYSTRRFAANFGFSRTVANGTYQLTLHMAESYWTSPGQRKFSVTAEGATILSNYDLVADVGSKNAAVKTFTVTATDGKLDLTFAASIDNAIVSGIELLPI